MAIKKDEQKGTWYAYGSYKDSLGNKHQYKKRGFTSKKEAAKYDILYKEQIKDPSSTMTLSKLFDIYLDYASVGLKDSTQRNIEHDQKWWLQRVGNVQINRVTPSVLQQVVDDNLNKIKLDTLKMKVSTIRTAFDYAIKRSLVVSNPANRLIFPKVQKRYTQEVQYWTEEEYYRFISFVNDPTDLLLFNTLYMMGMRVNEALALQWKDIDLDNARININKTTNNFIRKLDKWYTEPKTSNSYRNISMPKTLVSQYMEYKKLLKPDEDWVVFGVDRPIGDDKARYLFYKYINKANNHLPKDKQLQKIRLHGLRHSHASYLINNMISVVDGKKVQTFTPYDIANRLGDTINTLMTVYAHWFETKDDAIANMMNDKIVL